MKKLNYLVGIDRLWDSYKTKEKEYLEGSIHLWEIRKLFDMIMGK